MASNNYTFTKKLSLKGNLEIRTNFGSQKALVLTYVKGNFYINLYNNSKTNPGRCSISYSDLEELVTMKTILDTLKPQMIQEHNQLRPTTQQHPQQQQQQQDRQLMPPPPSPAPFVAQPIGVLGQPNKRTSNITGGPPAKLQKMDGEFEENWDPMSFFTQF